jgi:hypothetical protein
VTKRNLFRRLLAPLVAGVVIMAGLVFTSGQAAAEAAPVHTNDVGATLVNAAITFTTLTDNKDHDTFLSVQVKDSRNRIAAQTSGFFGEFGDQSSITLPLKVRTKSTWDSLENGSGTVTITITPNGNDTWNFAYELVLNYSDEDSGFHVNPGTSLNQDNRTLTDALF